jgi:cytochrome c-type biogenesis protein
MSLTTLSLLAAFGAGIVSFLSPCVLPLVPGYLSYLAGTSLAETRSQPTARWQVVRHALWFVLGFALLLTLLGAAAALLGSALSAYQQILERVGGLMLILFGIAFTRRVRIPWLSVEHRIQVKGGRSVWWRSGLIGMTFGASWSACSSPLLGAILVLTGVSSLLLQGMTFMLAFALGLGVPFLLVAVMVDRSDTFLRRVRRYTARLNYIGSATMILVGVLLVLGLFTDY